ncbi:hypothetical protein WKW77_07085 [Variovorax ureilyticus]|uniref:Tetratricopeptide repeat protein n=1 Tax=Variovorax ureilyticus TaxID=1836198 RepID=A0ABU8VCC4_9BURK
MSKPLAAALALTFALAAPTLAFADAESGAPYSQKGDPSIHQIYEAASAGRLSDADAMIAKVLKDYPSSAKAHFVHAELLAKEGRSAAARSELSRARELAPDLPFAKPEAIAGLVRALEQPAAQRSSAAPAAYGHVAPASTAPSLLPKVMLLLALMGAGALLLRHLMRRNMPAAPAWNSGGSVAPSYGGGYVPGYGNGQPMPPQPAPAGGMGLGGALATGAAMGLGAMAVEEAVRHFSRRDDRSDRFQSFGRDDSSDSRGHAPAFANDLGPELDPNMGGNDFGISDASSWDSGDSGSGGDDW